MKVIGLPLKIPYHKNMMVGFLTRYNDHLYNDVFQHCSNVLVFYFFSSKLFSLAKYLLLYSVGQSKLDTLPSQTEVFVNDALWKCMAVYQQVMLHISTVVIKNPTKFWFNTHTHRDRHTHVYSKYCNVYSVSIAFHHGRQNKCP